MLYEILNKQQIDSAIYLILICITIFYSIARPKLSLAIKRQLNSDIVRVIILSFIVYQSNYDYKLSIIVAIFYIMLHSNLLEDEINETYKNLKKI